MAKAKRIKRLKKSVKTWGTRLVIGGIAVGMISGFISKTGLADTTDVTQTKNNVSITETVQKEKSLDAQAYIITSKFNSLSEQSIQNYKGISTLIVANASLKPDDKGGIDVANPDGAINKDKINLCRKHGIKVVLMLNNFDYVGYNNAPEITQNLLNSPTLMKSVITQVRDLAVKNGFDGVETDFENMANEDGSQKSMKQSIECGEKFVSFLKDANKEFKAVGLGISVSTHLKSQNNSNLFINLPETIDAVDKVTEMGYGANYKDPCASTSIEHLEEAIEYSEKNLTDNQRKKVYLGIETNGYEDTGHIDSKGSFVIENRQVIYPSEVERLSKTKGFETKWDDKDQAPYLKQVKGNTTILVHYEDKKSVGEKENLIAQAGWGGCTFWGDPILLEKELTINFQNAQVQNIAKTNVGISNAQKSTDNPENDIVATAKEKAKEAGERTLNRTKDYINHKAASDGLELLKYVTDGVLRFEGIDKKDVRGRR